MGIFRRLLLLLPAAAQFASGAEQQTTFIVTKPTLISFFLDYTDERLALDGGNEALADFLFYLPPAENKLRLAGVEVHSVFKVKSFMVREGRRWRTVRPSFTVGYYLVAPGRKPDVEFGVKDAESIVDLANKYFKLPALSPAPEAK